MTNGPTLDEIGIIQGTDKSSLLQDYLRHYEPYLTPLRFAEMNVLEIGVLGGRSLQMWKTFFPRATIVGIDILELCRQFEGDRIRIEIGSQDDPVFLTKVCDKYPPTIVIDDGSHVSEHMRSSFRTIFPRLAPGGWYVMEDLHMVSTETLDPYDDITAIAKTVGRNGPGKDVDSIAFAHGAAFIHKADASANLRRLEQTIQAAEKTQAADSWCFLGIRMSSVVNMPDRAEIAMRKAVALDPLRVDYRWHLSHILMLNKDIPGAMAELDRAIELTRQRQNQIPAHFEQRKKHLVHLLAHP
jgi:hypothetical protein